MPESKKRRSHEERMAEIEKKELRLRTLKRDLQKKVRSDERKRLTRRKIIVGALVLKHIGDVGDTAAFERFASKHADAVKRAWMEWLLGEAEGERERIRGELTQLREKEAGKGMSVDIDERRRILKAELEVVEARVDALK